MTKKLFLETHQKEGEIYAGIILGERDYHLFLLPAKTEPLSWDSAVLWALHTGGSLPTRQEQSLLFANCKEEFEGYYYWSNEQYAHLPDYAWLQHYSYGNRDNGRKSNEYRARAVRRVYLAELESV